MVMHKVRATSYLRRTISEPFVRRRVSTLLSQQQAVIGGANAREYQQGLITSDSTANAVDENDMLLMLPQYTWQTDLIGCQQLIFTKLNILLIFSPLGVLSGMYGWGEEMTFWSNFLALIPLAGLLGNFTEELALHTGDLIGGLLNATFGNAVEMIITVQALRAGLIAVVQGSLLGSILSNLLLVLGMAFFAGGLFHYVQKFNAQGATCSTSLLLLASLAVITPTVTSTDSTPPGDVLMMSRLASLLIAGTYVLFLFFQLYTHLSLFKENARDNPQSEGASDAGSAECEEWPSLSQSTALVALLLITLLISLQSQMLVGSIEGVSRASGIPEGFIGVILLPIVGNAAEHLTAVSVAIKNKPDLTMGVAVGSSTQIAMFMVPFAVLAGWIMGVPMSLAFSNVSATVLAFSVLIVIGVVQDGESNWLEGVMLMVAYGIVAIVFWYDTTAAEKHGGIAV